MKKCTKCGVEKELSEFGKRSDRPCGHRADCKACHSAHVKSLYDPAKRAKYRAENHEMLLAYNRRYYQKNRVEMNRKGREWNAKNRDKKREYHLQSRYGMTQADYERMFEEQDGKCAICGDPREYFDEELCIDHDHGTGKVRGLLCRFCNMRIEPGKHPNPELVERYLEKYG